MDFEALRQSIERCDPDLMVGFYAENAKLNIVNADAPQDVSFELRGKAEIFKHLKGAFGQKTSHSIEREVVGQDRVMFREACEYPDGSQLVVASTLGLRGGRIVRKQRASPRRWWRNSRRSASTE